MNKQQNHFFQVVGILLIITTAQVRSQRSPLFYGWFFDEIVADGLKEITESDLSKLFGNVEEVQVFLRNVSTMAGIKDPLQYYTKPVDPNTGNYDKFFHITTFYCGTDDCSNYSRRVNPYLNQTFETHLVGLFFTPRTYGVRVNLTSLQKDIFDINESNDDMSRIFKKSMEPCDTQMLNGIKFCPQNDTNFQPTDTRAHITLGCAPNVSAVTTGLDLIEILELELIPSQFCALMQIEQGNLIQMGENCDIFVIYLKEKMVANSTFEVYYNNAVTLAVSVPSCRVQYLSILFLFFVFNTTFS